MCCGCAVGPRPVTLAGRLCAGACRIVLAIVEMSPEDSIPISIDVEVGSTSYLAADSRLEGVSGQSVLSLHGSCGKPHLVSVKAAGIKALEVDSKGRHLCPATHDQWQDCF